MPASLLPVYDKKRLMIATALATDPLVLLLDEPFGGLNPSEIDDTLALLRSAIRETGVAIVCIEHVMRALVALADRVLVMHHGAELFIGTPQEMLRDQRVIEVYLGAGGVPGAMTPRSRSRGLLGRIRPHRGAARPDLSVAGGRRPPCVIGPNGHGKTTLLLAISGADQAHGRRGHHGRRAHRGQLGRVDRRRRRRARDAGRRPVPRDDRGGEPADGRLPERLVARAAARPCGASTTTCRWSRSKRDQKARTLSGGERRLVGLGRGMMRPAELMLIDEPSLGLAPVAIEAVYAAIAKLRAESEATLVLVEENFTHIGGVADEVHVLEAGRIVRSGSFEELSQDRTVVETYLGSITDVST